MKRPALGHLLGYTTLTVILTAGAAQSLAGSNTVFADDIAPGQVRGSDLAANSVSSGKILNGSVKGSDVKDGSLTGTDINESTLVLPDRGIVENAVGPTELDASNLIYEQLGETRAATPSTPAQAFAECATGDVAIGGGFSVVSGDLAQFSVYDNFKSSDSRWSVGATNIGAGAMSFKARVMCLRDTP